MPRIRAYLTYKEVKSMLSIVANSSSISATLVKIIGRYVYRRGPLR